MVGTIAEADALNPAIEGDRAADRVLHLNYLVLLRPGKLYIRKFHFIDILKIVNNVVFL